LAVVSGIGDVLMRAYDPNDDAIPGGLSDASVKMLFKKLEKLSRE